MALEDLNDKLHSRDLHLNRVRTPDSFRPGTTAPEPVAVSEFQQTERWAVDAPLPNKVAPVLAAGVIFDDIAKKRRRKLLAWGLGGVALLALIIGVVMKVQSSLFNEEKIVLDVSGPGDVRSAELVTFTFEYGNNNWLALRDSTVAFEYPETFHPDDQKGLVINKSRAELTIGDIPSRAHGKITLAGKFYGSRGDQVTLRATLRYTPSNTTSAYEKVTEYRLSVASSPLFFEITAPQERASDQEVQYDLRYRNNGASAFSNLKVKMEYPEGFVFTDSDPRPTDSNTIWTIGTLAPQQESTIAIRGRLSGVRDEQKTVRGGIGFFQGDGNFIAYGESEQKTRVVASPFSIRQTADGRLDVRTDPGEILRYGIEYRNDGNVGIRDAIVTVEINSPYINLSTLRFDSQGGRGAYNPSSRTIVWKASDVPALARIEPGQEGSLSFSVATYSDPEKRGTVVHNPAFQTVAKIDSPDIPAIVGVTKVVASNRLTVKLNTVALHTLDIRYQDETFPNTGPVPPVVGQETTYTAHLVVGTSTNEINRARVSILLPSGIRYTGKESPMSEKILFNERTNELVWEVETLIPGQQREIVFQIGVTPAPSSAGQEVPLVSQAVLTGQDSFTEEDVKLEASKKSEKVPVITPEASASAGAAAQ
ncbi:MAG: hypothetical protein Q8O53_03990 [Candidatus Moranbacteria bacterium]|nr:hypothetical protein [Candidatus Moranbacteria bacterium]